MNKIYKVIYSKVRQCYVVVSEIAKSHGRHTKSSVAKSSVSLTAAVLLALGVVSFSSMPTAQATDSLFSNDYVGTNYKDENGRSYSANETPNYHGAGAEGVGSITLGLKSESGKNTITIGDRNASAATESIYIGAKYDADNQVHPDSGKKVVSVGYGSDAAGTGSIAIGFGAAADTFDNAGKGKNPDTNSQSIAIGYHAQAKQNNIAIGANSIATATASTEMAAFTGQAASKSYVSVGDGTEKSDTQYRRITNVADGAAKSDAATVGQLQEAINSVGTTGWKLSTNGKSDSSTTITSGTTVDFSATDNNVAVSHEGANVKIGLNKDLKGITSITSQSTTNSTGAKIELGANGTTISGGKVNVSNNKVTGLANGDVSTMSTDAITGKQLYDAKNALTVKKGWGIKITDNGSDGKTIELERNLGKNYGVTKDSNSKGKVEFEATGNNSLILGGSAINDTWYTDENDKNKYLDHAYGTFQDDSVLVGGENNATGTKDEENPSKEKGSVVVGGRYNTASGYYTLINGGSHNITNGDYSAILGGYKNEVQKSDWAGYSTIVGGAYNIASGTGATAVGGGDDIYGNDNPFHNIASGSYSTTVGGKGNEASGKLSVTVGGELNKADGWETVVIGGFNNEALSYYGNQSRGKQPFTEGAIVVGGQQNKNSGRSSSIFGGISNLISTNASTASIVGGVKNFASGDYTTVGGGQGNVVLGYNSTAFGGFQSIVNGRNSTGIAGGSTENNADLSLAAGYQSTVTEDAIGWEYLSVTEEKYKELMTEMQSGKMSGYYQYAGYSDGKYRVLHYKDISTALGYQATADESGTIALGHDKGDTFLTYKWQQKAWKDGNSYYTRNINTGGVKEISEEEYQKLQNSDGTWNDYTISPNVERGTYDTAYYNRLVKAADGQDAHDVVVREQLTPYTKSDATNIGANLKTYTVGNDGETITEADASDADKTVNENAWGTAIGNGKIADPTKSDTNDPKANGSKQLVTGGTVYSYNKPVAVSADKPLKYVKEGKTTGENLGILDATLNDKNHNIKYYAVDETTLPKLTNFNGKDYSNEKNDGAKGMGSIAAGFNTHADGIISTVAGSYSGVIGTGLQGATALSYGTFNINQNTDATKVHSGVANSIIGQVNMTKDSNAAIIYGAGNIVTDSYRPIDEKKAETILGSVNDPAKLGEAMKDAVKTSGGQVMVMGGGNNVESAYMTQVVGVGNTVKGNQVQNTKSEWVTDTSDTAIKDYDPEKSSQYNYVDGFNNEVINGKHDYVIGANNKLSGDSYDDDKVRPIKRSNRSNIVIGDNHTLTREQNTVIIGSIDTEDEHGKAQDTQTKARDAVIIGHNANATNDTGADNAVAIGRSANATGGNAVTIGVNTSAGANSITIGSESSAISGSNIAIGRYARVYGDNVTNAVALGKLAEAHVADGVAIGSNSIASTVAGKTGYDAQGRTHAATDADYAAWVSTDAAVSVGGADHEVKYTDKDNQEHSKIVKSTRQITNLAAGTDDTDAVNVAQLKSLQSGLTEDLTGKGLKFAANSGTEYTANLGSTVKIQGTKKKDGHEYTADNLTTEIDGSGNITILMDKNISADKIAVNGKDGKDAVSIAGEDGVGHIGLTGPAGTNGKNGADGKPGTSIDISVKNGYDGAAGTDGKDGIKGANGVDGTSLTRIVYKDATGEHQIATLEDGLKFKGDDGKEIAKKLNNTLDIIGGADSMKLTEKNIGVNKTDDGKLKIQLAQELNGITSIGNQKTEDGKTTGGKITFGTDSSVNVNGGKITNVGNGVEKDGTGKYTVTEQNKTNGANIGDVQNIVNDAKKELTDSTNSSLNGKANVDASNIGTNLAADKQQDNLNKWGNAIGTGKVEANNGQLVTGKTVYDEVRPKNDGSYVKKDRTTGENLSALDSKIGKLDETKKYNYIDSKSTTSISDNLGKLDTQVKNNADAIQRNSESIQNITNNVQNLSDNAVQYDKDSNKSKVTLAGKDGTTITKVKDGALNDKSTDAVNGKQLWKEQQDRKDMKDLSDTGKNVIRDLAKGSVKVIAGTNTTVTEGADGDAKTYAVNVEGNGKVESGNTGLISGGTAYTELRPADGSYVKQSNTTASNLTALDTQLKTTSDLIHTNTAGDTIQIGGDSKATKIDVSGKDKDGKSTGRVITGIVSDANDPNSAANVGYVNGITSASNEQIYRDMNMQYNHVENDISRAAAGSNALAALHPMQEFDPDDKAQFALGYGHYRNSNAGAVGAFYQPDENSMVNFGVSFGNGDAGINAGVTFKFGPGGSGHHALTKTQMAKVIDAQSKEIDELKKDNADKDKRIDALEQKMTEILAKLDKSKD